MRWQNDDNRTRIWFTVTTKTNEQSRTYRNERKSFHLNRSKWPFWTTIQTDRQLNEVFNSNDENLYFFFSFFTFFSVLVLLVLPFLSSAEWNRKRHVQFMWPISFCRMCTGNCSFVSRFFLFVLFEQEMRLTGRCVDDESQYCTFFFRCGHWRWQMLAWIESNSFGSEISHSNATRKLFPFLRFFFINKNQKSFGKFKFCKWNFNENKFVRRSKAPFRRWAIEWKTFTNHGAVN